MRLTAFAFGDLATGAWGVAVTTGETTVATFASELRVDDAQDESLLSAAGFELRFAPTAGPSEFAPGPPGIAGLAQLCTVQGALRWDGAERDVACLGMRARLDLPPLKPASLRAAAAWLDPEDGFALVALRPPGAAGHDTDAVACALLEDGVALDVDEPRFSTTYDGEGLPARAGLELWPAGADDESDGGADDGEERDDPRPSYPRRAAGERAGDAGHLEAGGIRAHVELFRWHARGLEGPGVYVLVPAP
jgi:hypothetical protein